MQHKEYWAERFEKLTDAQLNKGAEYYYNLQEQYRQAIASIEKDIAKWYTRYATENGITLTEAKRLLNGRELAEFRMDVKEYIKKGESLDPKWAKQLEAASTKVHVSRLEALKVQMQQQAEMLYGYEASGVDELARKVYTDGYYHTAYEIQKGIGVGFDLMQLDTNKIDKLISKPWAADGKNFSERIWNNRAQLVSELENRLTQSIIRGQSPKKVIAEIAERFNVNKSRAGALVMTESAFFASASQKDAFTDLDVEKYEILATLDSRTSETCRKMDGEVIPMSDYKPGVTAPPFHVRCRSTTVPFFDDEFTLKEKRAARDENGAYYTVPAQMKYEDWKKVWVDKKIKPETWRKKWLHNYKLGKFQEAVTAAESKVNTAQANLDAIPQKTYSNIWKDDVSLADWEAKQGSIAAKEKYFNDQLAAGGDKAKFTKLLDDLHEFDKQGAEYAAKDKLLKEAKKALNEAVEELEKFKNGGKIKVNNSFTQARKDAALWFTDNNGGFNAADKYFDPPAQPIFKAATSQEFDGFYTYTAGSGGHNRPLAGFQKPYYESGTGWEAKYNVGAKKVWIDYEGKGDAIRGLTDLINKSEYDKDVWLQSGQNFATVEGFLNIPYGTLQTMSDADLQQYVGRVNRFYQFMSTAVNKGGGSMFNRRPLKINFYAPKGSKMLYASDKGAFGKGENEMILQRGGKYKITKIYWGKDPTDGNKRKMFVDMEIHPEEGYDLFQQDPSEWKGSTKNYKS